MSHPYRPPHAITIGDFEPVRTQPVVPPRPVAYCRCGTRLSRYRPPLTSRCWACDEKWRKWL